MAGMSKAGIRNLFYGIFALFLLLVIIGVVLIATDIKFIEINVFGAIGEFVGSLGNLVSPI